MKIENRFYNVAIELHDSTIGSIDREGENLRIGLTPAYLHRSNGTAGVDPGTVWIQEVWMILRGVRLSAKTPLLPLKLADGSLSLGASVYNNCLPASLDHVGEVKLRLLFEDSSDLHIVAEEIHLILIGNPKYLEEFS